jgi:site-specific DNA-methyltransferase (cytosine-N4-specific)
VEGGSVPAKEAENVDRAEVGIAPAQPTTLYEAYRTDLGAMYVGSVESFLDSELGRELKGQVQLIFTSPPFPLNRKKRYGNKTGDAYLEWLKGLAPKLVDLLTPDGSIVMELGNAWEPRRPVMSTLALRALLGFTEAGALNLCQQFICHNPARLPSPAQWVNVERIRVKDSFTHVWWMAPTDRPKADNRNVLVPYSPAMEKLLETGTYNAGERPSGHVIGEQSFNKDNGGAIPPNVLEIPNTSSSDLYRDYCRDFALTPHPARMQPTLVEFFVKLLTDESDIVFDPFGGSNTTGAVAESLGRRWLATEPDRGYVEGSIGRFPQAQ